MSARVEQPAAQAPPRRGNRFLSAALLAKLAIIAVLAAWPFFYQDLYTLSWMTFAGLSLMVVVSVYLIIAQAGQLSFGHAAFYGVGAYTAAILSMKYNVPTLVALLAGAALSGLIAVVIGRPVLRLRYFYLALATIGLGIIFSALIVEARGVTGGTLGLAPVPPLDLFGFKVDTYMRQYYVVWIVALLILLFTERALGMRVGRALRAVATSEIAAQTLGVRTANWKLVAFVASAIFCAIAGALYAFTLAAITPGAFAFGAAILPIIMMLIGGGGSIWGGLVGAVLMTWLSNSLSGTQQWSGVIYAAIMILLLLFLPMGITGLFTKRRLVSVKTAFRRQSRAETLECATVAEADGSTEACETQVALPVYVPEHASAALDDGAPGALFADLRRQESGTKGEELLKIQDVSVDFGGLRAVNEVSLDGPRGTDRRPHRAERRRQDDPVQRGQQAAARLRRTGLAGRRRHHRPVAGGQRSSRHGPHLPEPAHLREHGRPRERPRGLSSAREGRADLRRARPAEAAPGGEGLAGSRHGCAAAGRPRLERSPARGESPVRAAAPGGDRPGAGLGAADCCSWTSRPPA